MPFVHHGTLLRYFLLIVRVPGHHGAALRCPIAYMISAQPCDNILLTLHLPYIFKDPKNKSQLYGKIMRKARLMPAKKPCLTRKALKWQSRWGDGVVKGACAMNEDYLLNKRILLVDDEQDLLDMVLSILTEYGFQNVNTAKNVKEALEEAEKFRPELAILDIMLPDGNGFDLMEQLKKNSDYPVLFLTARGEDNDKFKGFGLGADDYIVKPFLPKELLFRVMAILRRSYKDENPLVPLHDSQIDFLRAEVIKNNEHIPLTAKEHDLLSALYRNAGRIVTIDALCEAAWGSNPFGYENSLMAHIRRIREKIEENPSRPVSLVTVKGLGYKLIVEGK